MTIRPWLVTFVVALILGIGGGAVSAQVVVEPRLSGGPLKVEVPVTCPAAPCGNLADPLGELETAFAGGNWDTARALATRIVNTSRQTSDPSTPIASATFVVWIGNDPMGEPALRRLLVGADPPGQFSNDLPGLGGAGPALSLLFLSRNHQGRLLEAYSSVEEGDPLLEKIPDVIARVLPVLYAALTNGLPLLASSGPFLKGDTASTKAPSGLWVTTYSVPLPVERATITVTSIAAEPADTAYVVEQATKLALAQDAQLSACGSMLAKDNAERLGVLLLAPPCSTDPSGTDCVTVLHQGLRDTFQLRQAQGCVSAEHVKAMTAVDTTFRKALPAMYARQVKAEVVVKNRPLTHVSFGLVEAVIHLPRWNWNDRLRVTLTDGVYESDPLPRTLTMVTVNWSPKGYNPKSVKPTHAERWRGFGGAVIVPDVGIGAGASYMPVRGVTLNVGLAVLFTKGSGGRGIGEKPADPNRPYGLDHPVVFFAGVGFNYK